MKRYFAYVRVSTVKQGTGASLAEQKSAIEAYASRHGFQITKWFEELETAAKQGRRVFTGMLADLNRGRAAGLIVHKIDRSARNLRDWARLGDLIDGGVEVHFAHESLDLASRGGRLAADIQAVVAADYIRNLREETRKGFYGRLKQGLYPLPAPRGYLNCGRGKPKVVDPVEGPLVRLAFSLYASGTYGLERLRHELSARGLRTRAGKPLSLHGVGAILHNPFYVGVIRLRQTGEAFAGVHEPLISKALFEQVQDVLSGRVYDRPLKHEFVFRRFVRCTQCGRSLTAERQKGHAYYRCHGRACRGTSHREADLDCMVRSDLAALSFDEVELRDLREVLKELIKEEGAHRDARKQNIARDLALVEERLARLTDALIDGALDKAAFNERRTVLLMERQSLQQAESEGEQLSFWEEVLEKFERGNAAYELYNLALEQEKAAALKSVSSNLLATGKELEFPLKFPLQQLRDWRKNRLSDPSPHQVRTKRQPPGADAESHSLSRSEIETFLYSLKGRSGAEPI